MNTIKITISIHPPREGWDSRCAGRLVLPYSISIHPPREGWDVDLPAPFGSTMGFQSTHPVRGGTSTM